MLCRIWGPNEAENTPGSRPLGQLGGEENEQFLPLKKMQNGAVLLKKGISLPIFNLVLQLSFSFNIIP
jgi:hypothetical protein